eukprot:gene10415-3203_t
MKRNTRCDRDDVFAIADQHEWIQENYRHKQLCIKYVSIREIPFELKPHALREEANIAGACYLDAQWNSKKLLHRRQQDICKHCLQFKFDKCEKTTNNPWKELKC